MRRFVALLTLLGLAGCGGSGADDSEAVVAAFYPLAWAAEQVVSEGTEVVNLTPPGAEPHDVELSPRDLETIRDAQLVVYVGSGFQSAVEDAVSERHGSVLDVLDGDSDTHVWLDPARFARIVEELAAHVDRPKAGAALARRLSELDASYRRGLRGCARSAFVTSHASFGHLAARYGLTQLSLTGSSPEAEPGPRELGRLIDDVRSSGATTVFSEPLVSNRVAETVARETGAQLAVLDPLEGLSEERLAAGEDYLSVMHGNLAALREALGCR